MVYQTISQVYMKVSAKNNSFSSDESKSLSSNLELGHFENQASDRSLKAGMPYVNNIKKGQFKSSNKLIKEEYK